MAIVMITRICWLSINMEGCLKYKLSKQPIFHLFFIHQQRWEWDTFFLGLLLVYIIFRLYMDVDNNVE